jgi:hypothetical protein
MGDVSGQTVVIGGRDVKYTAGNAPSKEEMASAEQGLVRVLSLVVGVAAVAGAVLWWQKRGTSLDLAFLLPLAAIVAGLALSVVGLWRPDRLIAGVGGRAGSPPAAESDAEREGEGAGDGA